MGDDRNQAETFAERRRLILGMRAVGLLSLGWGVSAIGKVVGLVIQGVVHEVDEEIEIRAGTIERVLDYLASNTVVSSSATHVCGGVVCVWLGVYLLKRDAMSLFKMVNARTR